jgi:phosphatidylserine/phosphatidylglycerophosphate/cardiolipin synthase-like enzyme
MTRTIPALAILAAAAFCQNASTGPTITCAFSPRGQVLTHTVKLIDDTKTSLDVATYSINSAQITAALLAAHRRKVTLRIIVNPGQEAAPSSTAAKLRKAGIAVRTDDRHGLFHHKYLISDNTITITGSANHSKAAQEDNAENIVTITHAATAATFTADFDAHWAHARNFRDRRNDFKPPKPTAARFTSTNPTPTPKEPE